MKYKNKQLTNDKNKANQSSLTKKVNYESDGKVQRNKAYGKAIPTLPLGPLHSPRRVKQRYDKTGSENKTQVDAVRRYGKEKKRKSIKSWR